MGITFFSFFCASIKFCNDSCVLVSSMALFSWDLFYTTCCNQLSHKHVLLICISSYVCLLFSLYRGLCFPNSCCTRYISFASFSFEKHFHWYVHVLKFFNFSCIKYAFELLTTLVKKSLTSVSMPWRVYSCHIQNDHILHSCHL